MSTTSTTTERKDDEGGRLRRFEETDALDTAQIIAELRGEISDDYFYTIKDESGKEVAGLSWSGTKWIASQMAVGDKPHPLSVEHVDVVESPDGSTFRAIATVKDLATGEKRPGVYEQSKFRRRNVWDGHHKKIGEEQVMVDMYEGDRKVGREPQRDAFAYTIASSKAVRNGMRHFIPEPIILSMYEQWKANKNKGGKKEPPKDVTKESTVKDAPPPSPAKIVGANLAKIAADLKDFTDLGGATLEEVEGGFEVKQGAGLSEEGKASLRALMRTYGAKVSLEGESVTYSIKAVA